MTVLFGYRHVKGIPFCICRNPGNYMMLEQVGDNPLKFRFRCWCGRTLNGFFSSMDERIKFLAEHGVKNNAGGE